MAKRDKQTQAESDENSQEEVETRLKGYDKLIDRLKDEREAVKEMADRDYREVRGYVRSHPEEGVLAAFVGGLALGIIIGKLGR